MQQDHAVHSPPVAISRSHPSPECDS